MITVTQVGETYEIQFRYDTDLVELVKNVPGRSWDPGRKVWTIDKNRLGWFLNQLKGTRFEGQVKITSYESINQNASLDTTQTIPDIDISRVPYYVKEGATPYKHQLDFMKWAIDRQQRGNMSGFIVADDMGLAKTNESMNLAIYNQKQHGFRHCLVICCVNSSKYNWKADIEEHTRGKYTGYILGTRWKRGKKSTRSDTGSKEKLTDLMSGHMYGDESAPELPYFIILNIEAIRYREGKHYPIAEVISALINNGYINMVIIDEVHKNCSPSSQQGKQLLKIKQNVGPRAYFLPMTGTPIVNRPTDLFLPLKLINGHNYSSYYIWCQEYCMYGGYGDHEVIGYRNIPKLKGLLQGSMIRRLKSDVLDLPPKIPYPEYVENTAYQKRLYEKVALDIISQREQILSSMNPMAKLLRLRQVNGSPEIVDQALCVDKDYINKNAKLKRLLELLEDASERGEKTIVFSNWVEPLRTLYRFVSKRYKTCCFTGTMSSEAREQHKRVFQNNPNYTVLLGTIGAAGTTHTFTAAQNIIFYDEPWTPSDKEQAEDRAYRIGTTSSLKIFTLMATGTVDERVHNLLYTKKGISQYIVDDAIDLRKNPQLFDLLMCDFQKRT